MKKLQKGFTLIELLVVIAIIGILSSVVLASLTSARTRGTDAAIKADMSNMRAQAELYYSNAGNTYGSTGNCGSQTTKCVPSGSGGAPSLANTGTTTGRLNEMLVGLNTKVATSVVSVDADSWAAAAPLNSGTAASSWCVDSNGKSAEATINTGTATCN